MTRARNRSSNRARRAALPTALDPQARPRLAAPMPAVAATAVRVGPSVLLP